MRKSAYLLPLALVASLAFACTGATDELLVPESDEPDTSLEKDPELRTLSDKVKAGPPMVRTLSNREYLAAVSDLLGERLSPDLVKGWTASPQFAGFEAVPFANFDAKSIRDRADTVETILDRAVQSPKVMTCKVTTAAELEYGKCAKSILEPLATRAFGRPLLAAETAALAKSYQDALTLAKGMYAATDLAATFRDAVRGGLGSILMAPQLITRTEVPPSPGFTGERDLTAYELASRLSFMFVGSLPDDELWAKAQDGTLLSDPNVLLAQATRLMDTRRDVFVQTFMGQWFDFRAYDAAADGSVEHALWNETWRTLSDVIKNDLPVTAILKPGFTYVNKQVAAHYQLPGTFAAEFQRVPTQERGGILQQGSWLTLSASPLKTSPIHRGRLVQDRLLCRVVNPPDSALFAQIQAVSASIPASATVKQRLDQHRNAGPACKGCHEFMDPIGLGLEEFDQLGKVRTVYADTKQPVESDSVIGSKPFRGAAQLSTEIAAMPEYTRCVSEKLSVYSLRKVVALSNPDDAELLAYLSFVKDGKVPSLREMVLRLVKSAAFRKVSHGGKS